MATAEEVRAQLTAPGGVFEIAPAKVRGVPMRTYAAGPRAMRDIFMTSEQFGDRDFIVWYDERYTFREHFGRVVGSSAVVTNSGSDYFTHPDSVGHPVPTADIRIVRADGGDATRGEIGEVWFRGPNVVQGYWDRPEATAEAFTDGWFHTGDLGYLDEDGFLYVVDRIKDVVIRGGENVYCAEVEAVLFEHPAVLDVAVIGVPSSRYGEEVAAVVQLREGKDMEASELQQHAAGELASFKVPSVVLFWDSPLPRNAAGKVLKRELREEVERLGRA